MNKVLIAGYGAIAKRHRRILANFFPKCEFYIIRPHAKVQQTDKEIHIQTLESVENIDLAVIATPSAQHYDYLHDIQELGVPVFVEKPLVTNRTQLNRLSALTFSKPTQIGYNLRYLPSIKQIRTILAESVLGSIARVNLEVASYLPSWRPGKNYQDSYSVKRESGGGVVLDLSHELDLINWWFPGTKVEHVQKNNSSYLNTNVDEVVTIQLCHQDTLITMQMDYLSRQPIRRYTFVGSLGTMIWDLHAKSLFVKCTNAETYFNDHDDFDIDNSYYTQWHHFLSAIEKNQEVELNIANGFSSAELMLDILEWSS